jgi:hypothetical protein
VIFVPWLTVVVLIATVPPEVDVRSRPVIVQSYDVVIGIRITARTAGRRYTAGTVVPSPWPEQTVELISQRQARCAAHVTDLGGGAMLVVRTAALEDGQTAEAIRRFRVVTRSIPCIWARVDFPDRQPAPEAAHRVYLRASPGIEAADPAFRKLSETLRAQSNTDWDLVKSFYDWTVDSIRYQEQPFTSAKQALADRVGDCEERAAVFVALCRVAGIPARTVWSPGHCWAEFHFVDLKGKGHWIPAHTAGDRWFGELRSAPVILQKGDNFRVPESKLPARRLLGPWYHGVLPKPDVEFIQELKVLDTSAQPDRRTNADPTEQKRRPSTKINGDGIAPDDRPNADRRR